MGYLVDPANWKWITSGNNLRFLLQGFLVNLEIAAIAMALSLALGLLLALGRVSKARFVKGPVGAWIDVWRNLPLIFVILYLSLGLPAPWKDAYERVVPGFFPEALRSGRILAAILGLTLYNSAVMAEIFRAGIQSLERGQGEAAASLGMTHRQALRLVILPQGLRRMVPATVSQLITLNKDTTLVSIIAIQEVMRHARIVSSFQFGEQVQAPVLQVFLVVGAMFLVVNLALSRLSRRLEIRERHRTGISVEKVTGLEDQVALEPDLA
jgi:His/Glu/Gln/Arg/opine family amino acid ABC transporter permease subunit